MFHNNFKITPMIIILAIIIIIIFFMIYNTIIYSNEGFSLFNNTIKYHKCSQGFASYAKPGVPTKNRRLSVNLKNL